MTERAFPPPELVDVMTDWPGCRADIHREFDNADTLEKRGALLAIFHSLMNIVEYNLISLADLEEFKKTRE